VGNESASNNRGTVSTAREAQIEEKNVD
jgi:hypothetical protein